MNRDQLNSEFDRLIDRLQASIDECHATIKQNERILDALRDRRSNPDREDRT